MEKLNYTVKINAPKVTVWNSMLDSEKYKEWAKAFSADSQFRGDWTQGTYIEFIDPNMGGTKAIIEEVKPYDRIHVKHVAIINVDGSEDTTSDVARSWMDATETYHLKEVEGATKLSVQIHTHKDYIKMFNDCWPNALRLLKGICES